jgi:hypothetical protein
MFLQSQVYGNALTSKYSWGSGSVICYFPSNFGDSLLQVDLYAFNWVFFLLAASSADNFVVFLSSWVQVSLGTAHEQVDSIPKLSIPLASLKSPFSPQYDPHEFLIIQ